MYKVTGIRNITKVNFFFEKKFVYGYRISIAFRYIFFWVNIYLLKANILIT